MSPKYAARTSVPIERSAAEVERVLRKYGAVQFARGWRPNDAVLSFVMGGREVRFILPLPTIDEYYGKYTQKQSEAMHAQEHRRCWRALALIVKAKLEAVESGVVSFEVEFLPHFVLPTGATVGDTVAPQLVRALDGGPAPRLLGGGT